MSDKVSGSVEFYRVDGKWRLSIDGPFWVMSELFAELHKSQDREWFLKKLDQSFEGKEGRVVLEFGQIPSVPFIKDVQS